jgi:excinuclease ABC subunit B
MYADTMTDSMKHAIEETNRRRGIQQRYNEEHGITPMTIQKAVRDLISTAKEVAKTEKELGKAPEDMSRDELLALIDKIEKQMKAAAAELNFEMAAELRDQMKELKENLEDAEDGQRMARKKARGASRGTASAPSSYKRKRHYNRGGKA